MAQTTFRTYELVIGRPVYIGDKPTNIDKYTPTNKGGQAYRIVGDGSKEDLNIQFEVKKDNSKEPNKGYVTVCNLSDDTVNYLDANQRESLAVMLYAGYNNQNMLNLLPLWLVAPCRLSCHLQEVMFENQLG